MPACSWPQTPALHAGKTGSGWLLGRHVAQQMDIQQPPIAMPQAASQGHRLTRLAEWRGRCSAKGAGCRSAKAAKRRGAAGSKRWRAGGAKPSKGRGCSGWVQGHWHVRVSGNRYRQGMAFARVVHSQKPQTVTVPSTNAAQVLLPCSQEVAPNAGALAPKAGLLAAPKAGLLLGAPKGELEAPKAVVVPKAPPAGEAAPVLPLQPSCEGDGKSVHQDSCGQVQDGTGIKPCSCMLSTSPCSRPDMVSCTCPLSAPAPSQLPRCHPAVSQPCLLLC